MEREKELLSKRKKERELVADRRLGCTGEAVVGGCEEDLGGGLLPVTYNTTNKTPTHKYNKTTTVRSALFLFRSNFLVAGRGKAGREERKHRGGQLGAGCRRQGKDSVVSWSVVMGGWSLERG